MSTNVFGTRLSYLHYWYPNMIEVKSSANEGATTIEISSIGSTPLYDGEVIQLLCPGEHIIEVKYNNDGASDIVSGILPVNIQTTDILKLFRVIEAKNPQDLVSKYELTKNIAKLSSSLLSFIKRFDGLSEIQTDFKTEYPTILGTDLVEAKIYEIIDQATGTIEEVEPMCTYTDFVHTAKVLGVVKNGFIKYTITRLK